LEISINYVNVNTMTVYYSITYMKINMTIVLNYVNGEHKIHTKLSIATHVNCISRIGQLVYNRRENQRIETN